MLHANLKALATARVSAIRTMCGAMRPLTFLGVASPIPENVPRSVVTRAWMMAM